MAAVMTTSPAGAVLPAVGMDGQENAERVGVPGVGRSPCRKERCKRIARRDSPWCAWHFVELVSGAYAPRNEAVALESYVRRQNR